MAEHGKHMMPEHHKAMPKKMPPKKMPNKPMGKGMKARAKKKK